MNKYTKVTARMVPNDSSIYLKEFGHEKFRKCFV